MKTTDIIKDTKPLNLAEERQKFLDDPSYNPQFAYVREIHPEELVAWGIPKESHYKHALRMIEQWHTDEQLKPIVAKNPLVTEPHVEEKIAEFNARFRLTHPVSAKFTANTISRCLLSGSTLVFRTPMKYTESVLDDLFRHELETHYLRKYNHRVQGWANLPDPEFRYTEEGLANLHTFLLREEKLILKTYRTYIAVYLAQHAPFAEIYQDLIRLHVPKDTAFLLTLRSKRGLTDTSQPGGLTKDLSYFEGSVKVWDWLMDSAHDPHDLYLGRIGLQHIEEIKKTVSTEGLLYPTFFADIDAYRSHVKAIGERNHFAQLLDR